MSYLLTEGRPPRLWPKQFSDKKVFCLGKLPIKDFPIKDSDCKYFISKERNQLHYPQGTFPLFQEEFLSMKQVVFPASYVSNQQNLCTFHPCLSHLHHFPSRKSFRMFKTFGNWSEGSNPIETSIRSQLEGFVREMLHQILWLIENLTTFAASTTKSSDQKIYTFPEANKSHLKMDASKNMLFFGWLIFRCDLLVSGSVCKRIYIIYICQHHITDIKILNCQCFA